MILVVLGHVIVYESPANKFFAAFRMPFFFVMAGYLLNFDKWGGGKELSSLCEKTF